MDKKIDLAKELTNKSIEAFLLAIEIFNKPTIQYRVEGFGFFICNAWELMLKAYLIKIKGEILKEYEELYVPLFQASVINYSNKIKEYLNEDIGEHIPY